MAVVGFCETYDCWFMVRVKDVVEVQYGVVHSPCVKCYGYDGWVSIGVVGGVFVGRGRGVDSGCGGSLLGDGV